MTVQIAIPSYHRSERIGTATLPLLQRGGVDMSNVTVFLTDEDELRAYRPALERFGVNVEVGHGVGTAEARNHVARHYPVGTRLLSIDDDIQRLVRKVDDKTLVDVEDIPAMLDEGFAAAQGTLWSIFSANPNPFYMQHRVRSSGLFYAVGAFFGYTVQQKPHEFGTLDHGDDYERTLLFFDAMGSTTRLDYYSIFTKYWTEPGGLQDVRTPENVEAAFQSITARWPHLAYRYDRPGWADKGRPNLRLRNPQLPKGERR